jgi:glycosyltransferase involved in cell wall biosynthesis
VKFTIITPTYNRASLLPETIESVLAQTFTDFEYFIIDDGSTDATSQVIKPYLSDSRVRYYYHENRGEAETANRGWELAQGEYFTQINSDDPVYPNFLETMLKALDDNPSKILAYPDFDFINENGEITQTIKGRAWDFLRNLSDFSCEAACPGTVLRRSALSHLKNIKRKGYKHINDVEMYWNLALQGDFLHVPQVLATWRMHPGQISAARHLAIPECEDWFQKYFSQSTLAPEVAAVKSKVRKRLNAYYNELLDNSNLSLSDKKKLKIKLSDRKIIKVEKLTCMQLGDTDLAGNKFNGHDLSIYLNENGIKTSHFVANKQSSSNITYQFDNTSSNSLLKSVFFTKQFAESDILHLHLIHNTKFDIQHLPFLSKYKPVVWTLHDPWSLGGHCIYHHDCIKWKSHCGTCRYLDVPFSINEDSTAFEFAIKKTALSNANIRAIVASKWMQAKVEESPIWRGKEVSLIPFGIDQGIFKPCEKNIACDELKISPSAFVIFARTQRHFKGLHILQNALNRLQLSGEVVLLTVGENGLLHDLPSHFIHKEFGWLQDDGLLAKLYQASDIFLMPSEQEAFGMMAIEAMSCGKMVLALGGTSLHDVINAPFCGITTTEEKYADELQRICSNKDELRERSMRSLEFATKEYNKDIYIKRIIGVYEEVIAQFEQSEEKMHLMDQIYQFGSDARVQPEVLNAASVNCRCTKKSRIENVYAKLKTYYDADGVKGVLDKSIDSAHKIVAHYKSHGVRQTIKKIITKF